LEIRRQTITGNSISLREESLDQLIRLGTLRISFEINISTNGLSKKAKQCHRKHKQYHRKYLRKKKKPKKKKQSDSESDDSADETPEKEGKTRTKEKPKKSKTKEKPKEKRKEKEKESEIQKIDRKTESAQLEKQNEPEIDILVFNTNTNDAQQFQQFEQIPVEPKMKVMTTSASNNAQFQNPIQPKKESHNE